MFTALQDLSRRSLDVSLWCFLGTALHHWQTRGHTSSFNFRIAGSLLLLSISHLYPSSLFATPRVPVHVPTSGCSGGQVRLISCLSTPMTARFHSHHQRISGQEPSLPPAGPVLCQGLVDAPPAPSWRIVHGQATDNPLSLTLCQGRPLWRVCKSRSLKFQCRHWIVQFAL